MLDQSHATAITLKMCSAIISHILITLVLLFRVMHSVTATGVLSTLSSSAAIISATMAHHDTSYELHATHISIDSIKMTVDNVNDLSQLAFEPKYLNFDELSVGKCDRSNCTHIHTHVSHSHEHDNDIGVIAHWSPSMARSIYNYHIY